MWKSPVRCPSQRNRTGGPAGNKNSHSITWGAHQNLLQHEKWLDWDSNPDPSGTAPDALPLSYQVLQGIAMWPDSPFCHAPWIHHIRSSADPHSGTALPGPITYCSIKSDQTGTQTQTLLELHQMLYHWAIRSSRVLQCDRIPHSVKTDPLWSETKE